jgi:hypothetical protein
MGPLTFVCGPAVVAVMVIPAVVQLPFAVMVPPLKEMVFGEVVVSVPPQVAVEVVETVKPAGNVSVKETPVAATLLGLDRVNVRAEVPPTAIGLGLKVFEMVGGVGTPQPVKIILSRANTAASLFAPTILIRNAVVFEPVVTAEVVIVENWFLVNWTPLTEVLEKEPPLAFEYTYIKLFEGLPQSLVVTGLARKDIPTLLKWLVSNENSKYEGVVALGKMTGVVGFACHPVPPQELIGSPTPVKIVWLPAGEDRGVKVATALETFPAFQK